VWRAVTLQQRVWILYGQHTACHAEVEKVCWLCQIMKETLSKNNLNFVKDKPMIYINLIVTVIIVCEKKIGGITFIPPLVVLIRIICALVPWSHL
jgi:hypothetical protein